MMVRKEMVDLVQTGKFDVGVSVVLVLICWVNPRVPMV